MVVITFFTLRRKLYTFQVVPTMTYRTTMGTISMYFFIGNSAGISVCHTPLTHAQAINRSLTSHKAIAMISLQLPYHFQGESESIYRTLVRVRMRVRVRSRKNERVRGRPRGRARESITQSQLP